MLHISGLFSSRYLSSLSRNRGVNGLFVSMEGLKKAFCGMCNISEITHGQGLVCYFLHHILHTKGGRTNGVIATVKLYLHITACKKFVQ